MKNLIGMTDFVLEQIPKCEIDKEIMSYNLFILFEKYANFLKQPPQQWMFDKEDERCLFDDYSLEYSEALVKHFKKIEDLVQYNLRITPTALKQIGL